MEFVDHLKSSVDIVQVIGEYVRLRKVGKRYTGLCPFHSEKTPSFNVNAELQFFKCFGCGEAGDVISFVMKKEGVSFYEALKTLADRNGIPMPKRSQMSDDDSRARAALHQMHELAQAEFIRALNSSEGAEARRYLESRGVSRESLERFSIGYAPRNNSVARILEREGFTAAEREESSLVLKRDDGTFFDRFRNRLIFPIHNEFGKPIAFGGRALSAEDQPKYLNSSETKIYRKSAVLYNLHRAKDAIRQHDRAILVEGYMDVVGVCAAGFSEVVASCGTSLTSQQVHAIHRHSESIVVNFDPDSAGAKAAERSVELLLAEGMRVRILSLEGGLDPDEFCRANGAEAYQQALNNATGYFHWLADRARSKFDARTPEGRYAAFRSLLPSIERVPDHLQRLAVAEDAAAYLGIRNVADVRRIISRTGTRRVERSEPPRSPLRHSDRILIAILLSPEVDSREFFEILRGLPSLNSCAAGRIYEALLAIQGAGEHPSYSTLHARLNEADQEMLSNALLHVDSALDDLQAEDGIACLEALIEEERAFERDALKSQIREAERTGRLEDALHLARQLDQMRSR